MTLAFTPIAHKRTVEAVVEALEDRILNGALTDGDRLPSEEQLAVLLGVGRRAIREALKILETKGLLEVRMGVGAVVKRNDLDSFLSVLTRNVGSYLSISKADLKHIIELRALLEGAALESLARSRDEALLQRLEEAIARQHQTHHDGDYLAYQEWHLHFHQQIVDALNNPVISMIYKQVLALVRPYMERAGSLAEAQGRAIHDHERLVDAARRGAAHELRDILAEHLAHFIPDLDQAQASSATVPTALPT